jgi:hypothetical protein
MRFRRTSDANSSADRNRPVEHPNDDSQPSEHHSGQPPQTTGVD